MRIRDAGTLAALLRWLGPWSTEGKPAGVTRTTVDLPRGDRTIALDARHPHRDAQAAAISERVRVRVYRPTSPRGVYHLVPGLHYLGPDDVRLDRFATILAAAGFVVVAPCFPAFLDLTLRESVLHDVELCHAYAESVAREIGAGPPAVFSISFGSLLALHLASRPHMKGRLGGVVLFGGYADLFPTVRFAVTGRATHAELAFETRRDPLNAPVVYLNLLPFLAMGGDRAQLARAFRKMVTRTWGRMELKVEGARDGHAHAIARRLPEDLRLPFLRGCGLAAGDIAWLEDGIERAGAALAAFDATPKLGDVHARVTLVHGRDDDVIPYLETLKIAERLPGSSLARTCITGLYGHTAAGDVGPREVLLEIGALTGMLADLARAPDGRT